MTVPARVAPATDAAGDAAPEGDGRALLLAPDREPTRLVDAALGSVALFAWAPAGLPSAFSVGLAAVAVLVLLGATRRPTVHLSGPTYRLGWLGPAMLAVLGFLVVVSVATPDAGLNGWPRRALRLALVVALLLFLVAGRIHYPSVVRGMAFGLAANAVLFVVGVAPRPYGAYLSGFLLDKNVAGMTYTAVGLLLAGIVRSRRDLVLVVAATGGLVWLTGSRTSLAALGCGLAWLVLRPRLGVFWRLVLAASLAGVVQFTESNYARVGVFAERFGSDQLRERIDDAARTKVSGTPWTGSGLGTAYVRLEDQQFFFHNSYWSAVVEGGWVLVGAYVAATALVGIGILRRGRTSRAWAAAEAANVALLVCALRLGEVFGTTVAMVALAGGALGLMASRLPPDEVTRGGPGRVPR